MNYIICNQNQERHFSKLISAIGVFTNEIVFLFDEESLESNLHNAGEGFILIEVCLSWNNRIEEDYYGFDIAADIRRRFLCKNAVVLYSSFSQGYFEKLSISDKKYKILFGRGTGFLKYPFGIEKAKKMLFETCRLSAASLHDVITMLCDLKGIVIDRLNHELSIGVNIDTVIDSVSQYLSPIQKHILNWAGHVSELKSNNSIDKRDKFLSAKYAFITQCNIHLNSETMPKLDLKKRRFSVLVLDDRGAELDLIQSHLIDHFDLRICKHADEAVQYLQLDTNNDIVAVICDWRLYTDDKSQYWQSLQGYEVLEIAARTGLRALYALTSQSDFIVHQIRNIQEIKFQLFKKENLQTTDQWILFSDIVYEACIDIFDTLTNLPNSKLWTNSIRDNKDLGTTLQKEYVKIRSECPEKLDEISAAVDSLYRDIENHVVSGMSSFLGEISTKKINQETLIQVLIQRRIWIALFKKGYSPAQIYSIMEAYIGHVPEKNSVNQHKNKLCITENDIKNGRMFPEEKAWLKKWIL